MNGITCANKMIDGLCELTDQMSAQERRQLATRLYKASKTMSPDTWQERDGEYRRYRDQNEQLLVDVLENAGATVIRLDNGGPTGTPDLLVGYLGRNFLVEVKTLLGENSVFQAHFAEYWQGQLTRVRTISELADALDFPAHLFDDIDFDVSIGEGSKPNPNSAYWWDRELSETRFDNT